MTLLDKFFGRLGNRMFQLAYIHAQMRDGAIPDIYVQDPKYFEKYGSEIKQMFGSKVRNRIDKVAIHVRRGDYVGNSFYVDLTQTEYYTKAMAEFPGKEFIVFSDDIDWCKRQELFKGCEFSVGRDEEEDMNYMASCVGQIIANSSFSWWGAYISPFSQKVVAPLEWYSDKVERTVCPKEWIRV